MSEDIQTDVIEETTDAPSAENQTVETTQEVTQDDSASKTIPYERFQEVNESKKQLENRLAEIESKLNKPTESTQSNPQEEQIQKELKRHLESLGYVNKEDLAREKADKEVQDNIKNLSKKYDGSDGRPKFSKDKVLEFAQKNYVGDLESAYKLMNEAALMDHAIKQAMGKTKGTKSESSDGSGASNIGTTNQDLMGAVQRGDKSALNMLIKRAL